MRRRDGAGGDPNTAKPAATEQDEAQVRRPDAINVIPDNGDGVGDGAVAGRAIGMPRRHHDQPFFLAVGFSKSHSPPEAPQRFFDLYDPATIPLPVDFAPRPTAPAGIPPIAARRNTDLLIGRDASPDQAREMIRAYGASLSWMDHNVGRVVGEPDRLGLRDDGAPLHHDFRQVQGRNDDRLRVRGQDLGRNAPEPLHHDGWRDVLLRHVDERHDGLLLQPHGGHVQVRTDRKGRSHDLHQRR